MYTSPSSVSDKQYVSASEYAKSHYLYIQEIGTLTSLRAHISRRSSLDSYLLLIIQEGEGTLHYQGQKIPLASGDRILLDCSKGYAHESSELHPWTLSWIHYNGALAKDLYRNLYPDSHPSPFRTESLQSDLSFHKELRRLCFGGRTEDEFRIHAMLMQIALRLGSGPLSEHPQSEIDSDEQGNMTSLVQKIMSIRDYIFSNYSTPISLEELSKAHFISKFHMDREYKRRFGITIGAEITRRRITRAKELLRYSSSSLDAIAKECGYDNGSYFSKVFRREEGITPKEYRNSWTSSS